MSTMVLPQLALIMPPLPGSTDEASNTSPDSTTTKQEPMSPTPNAAVPTGMMPNAAPAAALLNGMHSIHGSTSASPIIPGELAGMHAHAAAPHDASESMDTSSTPSSPQASNGPGRPRKYTKRGTQPPKAFSCDICGKEFRRKFNMRVHKRTHLHHSKRPWACQHCNETFAQKSNFKRHVLTRHEKPIKCPSCKERFATEEEVTEHLTLAHPGDHKRARIRKIASRPKFRYRCSCKKRFDLLKDLVQHQNECPQNLAETAAGMNTSQADGSPTPAAVAAAMAAATSAATAAAAVDSPLNAGTMASFADAHKAAFAFHTPSPTRLQDPTLDPASRVTNTPPPLENPDLPNAVPNGAGMATVKAEHGVTVAGTAVAASRNTGAIMKLEHSTAAAVAAATSPLVPAALPALSITVQAHPGGFPSTTGTLQMPTDVAGHHHYPFMQPHHPATSTQYNPTLLANHASLQQTLAATYPGLMGSFPAMPGLVMNGAVSSPEQKMAQELLKELAASAAALISAHQRAANAQGVNNMPAQSLTQ